MEILGDGNIAKEMEIKRTLILTIRMRYIMAKRVMEILTFTEHR